MGRWAVIVLALLFPADLFAADEDPLVGNLKDDPKQPWHIVADQLTSDDTAEQYIGKGNVVITKQGRKFTADFVRFDRKTMDLFAAGNVVMTVGDDVLKGSRMDMNLDTEIGTVYDGTIFIQKSNFFISGATLQKIGDKTFAADYATLTSCEGETPDWSLSGM